MRRLADQFFAFLRYRFADHAEYTFGAGMALWGLLIMLPSQTFTPRGSFRYVVESPLSEFAWGCLIALMGLAQLLGAWFQRRRLRQLAAFLIGTLWGGIGVSLLAANPDGAWPIFLIIISGTEGLIFLRHGLRGA